VRLEVRLVLAESGRKMGLVVQHFSMLLVAAVDA
jgi:hypothetical protein